MDFHRQVELGGLGVEYHPRLGSQEPVGSRSCRKGFPLCGHYTLEAEL